MSTWSKNAHRSGDARWSKDAHWLKDARQKRSRATEKALAVAARDLLSEKSYEEIRVGDVARAAGTSVGGFYARYSGKNALLHLADIDFLDECVLAFDRAVPPDFGGTLEELLRSFVRVMVLQFDRHRDTLVQALKHASEDDKSDFRRRATAFNNHVHGRLRTIMSRHTHRMVHENADVATNMAIFMASAAAREAVLRGALAAYPITLTLEELIDELAAGALAYLTGGGR
jgi:AcrR family transcriptional regulator